MSADYFGGITTGLDLTQKMVDDAITARMDEHRLYIEYSGDSPIITRLQASEITFQETQMSKIPPREWPKYSLLTECRACGTKETNDSFDPGRSDIGEYVNRECKTCGLIRYERPLDFDFDKWKYVWDIEADIEVMQKSLAEARKAVE